GTYATALIDRVVKPSLPVANFAAAADGLTVTCQNHATGETGWWDFGDGTPLEPFAPGVPSVSHTYTKAGSYSVKLVVRNFTADENERSVAVEVGAGGKGGPGLLPRIATFAVQPVSPAAVAPATFRLTADVTNADSCVFDYGDGRMEVAGGGKIDRLVTFDKPGPFSIQLVAHNATAAAKQGASVKVDAPTEGTLVAVLRVLDSGTRVERQTHNETVAVPAPKDARRAAFTRSVPARPGGVLVSAAPAGAVAGVRNLRVEVSADRKAAVVSGEWAGKGGSDVLVPVLLTEERTTTVQGMPETITGVFTTTGNRTTLALPLPPAPTGIASPRRKMSLEIRQSGPGGTGRVVAAAPDVTFPWTGRVAAFVPVRAEVVGGQVVLTAGN
ncbi:MAG TPA: PKD domain-containing protein, partial [Urbifossiella sp.]|nr:PKD domain-containing protein [Urbifossiella sp.]